ncbi:MAG: 2-succinyl-5-enolpyruvyl-6-hydroxy-3-cyclohexene-1-carboxylic-acid synthase [Prevotella sp.]|nr:2-succinyl-5-enolpyruvyl-6-hydroxy-3-cyclohexene-1-carboxylic-acid synthase [Prevotella sp.]MDD7047454.1 2-succinyl-5-enolpyruvyl-6-hydroxy-3-cyclohexene-1-carboxylic-acid synthase [Prevotella sp.]MDY5546717.1 2-succinyl-5-enolpyruvyl-6-hydroxy-3-cyclohexene-1-carboxylic-acid synthase [Prevotella sp.]
MYSDKYNVNILTAMLVEYGIRHAVLCPGNRNAPIVHNLVACGKVKCYPVTDERSAGFFALGIRQATGEPVAVCVTSGSALLNLAPAVAEARLQHQGLIVISADRPAQWIGQWDGQTIPQPDALATLVSKRITLPEAHTDEERWYCQRLANEALAEALRSSRPSVHINVPISEPLFHFTDKADGTVVGHAALVESVLDVQTAKNTLIADFLSSTRPMIVLGQMAPDKRVDEAVRYLSRHFVVMREPLSCSCPVPFDDALARLQTDGTDLTPYSPDFVLYVGGNMVSKRLRQWLRSLSGQLCCWTVDGTSQMPDTFMCHASHLEGNPVELLSLLASVISSDEEREGGSPYAGFLHSPADYKRLWDVEIGKEIEHLADTQPAYSPAAVVKYFEEQLEDMEYDYRVHYANSTSVRLACRYADHYVWCNRGVNGIEGSLSTAVGHAAATDDMVFCVVGDLSFFYDQNALWNRNLSGNLRVILLNNHGGDIFNHFEEAKKSPAFDKFILAGHNTEARGICTQNDVGYLSANNLDEMHMGIVSLLTTDTHRPMLLECFF